MTHAGAEIRPGLMLGGGARDHTAVADLLSSAAQVRTTARAAVHIGCEHENRDEFSSVWGLGASKASTGETRHPATEERLVLCTSSGDNDCLGR